MSRILCVTNRKLCEGEFLERIEELALSDVDAVILREKDLSEQEYLKLAEQVALICESRNKKLIIHNYPGVAAALDIRAFHGPLHVIQAMSEEERSWFRILGASCHSAADAELACAFGCTYITAGHVYDTDCKKGLPGRGVSFVREVCEAVSIPVYAIGGIDSNNAQDVIDAGARGVALMSSLMKCRNVAEYIRTFDAIDAK